eukprot:gene7554-15486_t
MFDDDEVVREIDVYISDELELFLLQFPLKPVYSELPAIHSGRLKPIHNRLELSTPYDPQIYSPDLKPHTIKYQKLISSKVALHSTLGVGVIRNGAMHITPVKQLLQLRPSFKDLVAQGEIVEMMKDDDEENEGKDKQSMQQVQMRRKESEKAQSTRLQSFAHLQAQEDSEQWRNLKIYTPDSIETGDKFEQMYFKENITYNEDEMEIYRWFCVDFALFPHVLVGWNLYVALDGTANTVDDLAEGNLLAQHVSDWLIMVNLRATQEAHYDSMEFPTLWIRMEIFQIRQMGIEISVNDTNRSIIIVIRKSIQMKIVVVEQND